jgi:hypothetical protein
MACVWLRLHGAEPGETQFLAAARRAIAFVAGTQAGAGAGPALRGAVQGAQAVWGEYLRFKCPNWAAKFLVDALLARGHEVRVFDNLEPQVHGPLREPGRWRGCGGL